MSSRRFGSSSFSFIVVAKIYFLFLLVFHWISRVFVLRIQWATCKFGHFFLFFILLSQRESGLICRILSHSNCLLYDSWRQFTCIILSFFLFLFNYRCALKFVHITSFFYMCVIRIFDSRVLTSWINSFRKKNK